MRMTVHGISTLACLATAVSGLVEAHAGAFSTPPKSDYLCFAVGQPVTLSGKFSLFGKLGAFITIGDRTVYLIERGSFSWGPTKVWRAKWSR